MILSTISLSVFFGLRGWPMRTVSMFFESGYYALGYSSADEETYSSTKQRVV
jgi:hypothetical protein